MVLSANTQESLKKQITNCQEYLAAHEERKSDVSYTLSQRREHLPFRAFFITGDAPSTTLAKVPANVAPITMIFSGQGAQWPEMAKELISTEPNFRKDILTMDAILQSLKHPPTWLIESKSLYLRFEWLLKKA